MLRQSPPGPGGHTYPLAGKVSGCLEPEKGAASEALWLPPVPEPISFCIPHSHLCRLVSVESGNQDVSHKCSGKALPGRADTYCLSIILLTPLPMAWINSILDYTIVWLVPQGEGMAQHGPTEVPSAPIPDNTSTKIYSSSLSFYKLITCTLFILRARTPWEEIQIIVYTWKDTSSIYQLNPN